MLRFVEGKLSRCVATSWVDVKLPSLEGLAIRKRLFWPVPQNTGAFRSL